MTSYERFLQEFPPPKQLWVYKAEVKQTFGGLWIVTAQNYDSTAIYPPRIVLEWFQHKASAEAYIKATFKGSDGKARIEVYSRRKRQRVA